MSPASPEYAIRVCLFSSRVLSSVALRIVAPLIAALEAAMRVKSLPVIPRSTSLQQIHVSSPKKFDVAGPSSHGVWSTSSGISVDKQGKSPE